jgi:hypothetical protein
MVHSSWKMMSSWAHMIMIEMGEDVEKKGE